MKTGRQPPKVPAAALIVVSEGCHKSVLSVLPRVPTRVSTAEGTDGPVSAPAAFASHCLLTTSHLEAGNVVQSTGQEGSRTPGPWAVT